MFLVQRVAGVEDYRWEEHSEKNFRIEDDEVAERVHLAEDEPNHDSAQTDCGGFWQDSFHGGRHELPVHEGQGNHKHECHRHKEHSNFRIHLGLRRRREYGVFRVLMRLYDGAVCCA